MLRPHIVILGAGFGGVYVAKKLAARVRAGEIDLTIINKTNNFLFTPLLHEVATGGLSPRIVAESLREVFVSTGIRIVQGEADVINPGMRTIIVKNKSESHSIEYDYLVIATGAEPNYYGIPGAEDFSYPLKSLSHAAAIRNKVIDAFEEAVLIENSLKRIKMLSFVVVGGGATGVEVAAELVEFVAGMVNRYYGHTHCRQEDLRRCEPEEPSITLIHAGHELLEQFKPELRAAALKRLTHNNVQVYLNTAVTSVSKDSLTIVPFGAKEPVETIPASMVIWTAGVKALLPRFEDFSPTLVKGRISVDETLKMVGNDRIFVLGDAASEPTPSPQLAQVAEAQSIVVARNLLNSIDNKPLRKFKYKSQGSMVSVGQWFAIGEIMSLDIAGRLTWALWRAVYLFKFASWKKRVRIAFEWLLEFFFPRDITKIS